MDITIRTNHHLRDLIDGWQLTDAERAEFDYIENIDCETQRFLRYKGNVYDINEFTRLVPAGQQKQHLCDAFADPHFCGWHGIHSESFFSGILVRFEEQYEKVIVGQYFS